MSLEAEGSRGAVAWRLLAALEGAALALAAGAVLARLLRGRLRARLARAAPPPCTTVLISNESPFGIEIRKQLESRGCTVRTATSGATSGAAGGAGGAASETVDVLVMVGAEETEGDLAGLVSAVSEDVSRNLKLLENLSMRVRRGGRIVWASTGAAGSGAFSEAGKALSDVIRAQLTLVADAAGCKAVWLGRCERRAERAAERVAAELLPQERYRSIRNAAVNVGAYVGRCLKIVS